MRAYNVPKPSAARSSSGQDVREITGYSIRGFSVIEFEKPGLRALIVRVTLDYMALCGNSATRVFRPLSARYDSQTASKDVASRWAASTWRSHSVAKATRRKSAQALLQFDRVRRSFRSRNNPRSRSGNIPPTTPSSILYSVTETVYFRWLALKLKIPFRQRISKSYVFMLQQMRKQCGKDQDSLELRNFLIMTNLSGFIDEQNRSAASAYWLARVPMRIE